MAKKHFGSAIVMENAKLVGILTTVDVCCALGQIIEEACFEARVEKIKRIRHGL